MMEGNKTALMLEKKVRKNTRLERLQTENISNVGKESKKENIRIFFSDGVIILFAKMTSWRWAEKNNIL